MIVFLLGVFSIWLLSEATGLVGIVLFVLLLLPFFFFFFVAARVPRPICCVFSLSHIALLHHTVLIFSQISLLLLGYISRFLLFCSLLSDSGVSWTR